MISSRKWIATASSLALVFASAVASADPGNGKGQGNGKGNPQNMQDHGKQKDQGNQGSQGKQGGQGGQGKQGYRGGPSIDRGNILGIVGGYRDYWSPGPALPPGIQKNLARGKPLPPGIAKKLDGRLLGHLPRYDGYEWQQVGTDLILVALATGLIYEIVNGAFD